MAYTKTVWVNDQAPAINADNLNKIEEGIYEAHELAEELDAKDKLLLDYIPGTTQSYTMEDGSVSEITHVSGNTTVRTDVFTYGTSNIVEMRTLNTGECITITTDLSTYETTITYSEE